MEECNLVEDPTMEEIRRQLKDELMELIIRQDYPKTRRNLFTVGVH